VIRPAGKVPALVLGAELDLDLRVGSRRRLAGAVSPKPGPKIALRRAVEREEVGRDQARTAGRVAGGRVDGRVFSALERGAGTVALTGAGPRLMAGRDATPERSSCFRMSGATGEASREGTGR
jgi:hypothetical protein